MVEELEEKGYHMPLVEEIQKSMDALNQIDAYFKDIDDLQSKIDLELSDIYHFIQKCAKDKRKLTGKECSKLIEMIQERRLIREGLRNDYEIRTTYNTLRAKIQHPAQREFFMTDIYKKEKSLYTDYKWRELDEETILSIIQGKEK